MSILYYSASSSQNRKDEILDGLQAELSGHSIHVWPNCPNKETITTAIAWQPPVDFFDGLCNLKYILSVAAGVDHLLDHPALPDNVDIVRLCDAGMGEPMAQYVLYGALHAQRQMSALALMQKQKQWRHDIQPLDIHQFHVGVLGAGELSLTAAKRLSINNFKVSCWSRSAKQLDGITHFEGEAGLEQMLPQIDALVCLLPLTRSTQDLLNAPLFNQLRKGAYLINPGRGGCLDEDALLDALNSGQLSGALLDVFKEEPLPTAHPFWTHPNIVVTPHVAAPTSISGAIEQLAESVQKLERGEMPKGLVNRDVGY